MNEPQAKIKSLTGVKNAILKHKKVWLSLDEKSWVYAELKPDGSVFINYGLDEQTTRFHIAMANIFDFLSFKRSTDLLGG